MVILFIFALNSCIKNQESEQNQQTDIIKTKSDTMVYNFTDLSVYPTFGQGKTTMLDYLVNNLNYPQVAKDAGVMGTLYIKLIVKSDGTIGYVDIFKTKVSDSTNTETIDAMKAEAVRVIQNMPKWEP